MRRRPAFPPMHPLTGRGAMGAILAVALLAACAPKPPPLPLQTVLTIDAKEDSEPVYLEWIGTLQGSVNASIRAQVGGYLIKQDYQEGTFVKAGTVMFEIDPRPYQAALDQAKGNLAGQQATQLKSQQDLTRYKALVASGAVSQQEYQNAEQVNNANLAAVQSAQAAVQTAELNLGYTQIKSAIDGVAGIAEAQVGDLIGQNSEMTTVSTIDPIKASFNVSEQKYLAFTQKYPDAAAAQAAAKKNLELTLLLSDGTPYNQKGTLDIVNRQVNQQTGTIEVVGLFPNPQGVLRPGAFVRVRVSDMQKQAAIMVPQRAVMQIQTMYLMAVVNPDDTISLRNVEVGNRIGDKWIITDGIKAGDKVVVEGVDKVKDGQKVNVQPYVDANAAAPVPANPVQQ